MKHNQEVPRNFALIVCALMFIAILIVLFAPRAEAQSMAKDHAKLQKELSYENVMKRNGYGTVKEAKEIYKEKKRSARGSKKKSRIIHKRELYLTKARELGVR
jgi:hypothetical protein